MSVEWIGEMDEVMDSDTLVERLRPWLRDDYAGWFEAGLAWGMPRCRTDEERRLFPFLLLALSPYSAVVSHRRLPEGAVAAFRVGISRPTPEGPERMHLEVVAVEEGTIVDSQEWIIRLSPARLQSVPWAEAARTAAEVQAKLCGMGGG